MKRIKISLVALLLLASAGITLATGSKIEKLEIACSKQPHGQGGQGTVEQFGCMGPVMTTVCCYRIPDNYVYYKIQ